MKPRYIQETMAQARERVPAMGDISHTLVRDGVLMAIDLVDSIDGYDLFQVITLPMEPCIFIFKARP